MKRWIALFLCWCAVVAWGVAWCMGTLHIAQASTNPTPQTIYHLPHGAPSTVPLPDPWRRVGFEAHIEVVRVGGYECVVLRGRTASDPQMWCRPVL